MHKNADMLSALINGIVPLLSVLLGAFLTYLFNIRIRRSSGGFAHYNVINLNDPLTFTGLVALEGAGVPKGEYGVTVEASGPDENIERSVTFVFKISKPGDILRMSLKFSMSVQVSVFHPDPTGLA